VKPRYYCQAQIDQNLSTQEINLQNGTITVKKDLSEFPIRRKLCAQPRKDRQWSYAFPPHTLEEINVDNAPDEAMRILEQALDLVRGHYTTASGNFRSLPGKEYSDARKSCSCPFDALSTPCSKTR